MSVKITKHTKYQSSYTWNNGYGREIRVDVHPGGTHIWVEPDAGMANEGMNSIGIATPRETLLELKLMIELAIEESKTNVHE